MSNGLIIILIIVVWLFVLAPLLMRGQKLIHKAGEGFDGTRVIHEGGSGALPPRRRPRLTAADVRPGAATAEDEDLELVDVAEILIDDDLESLDLAAPATGERTSRFRGLFTRQTATPEAEEEELEDLEVVDGDIVHELEAGQQLTRPVGDAGRDWNEWEEEDTYSYDDSYTSPGDFLYPESAVPVLEALDDEAAEHRDSAVITAESEESDLSAEEIEFAEHRAARGGWDPVADAANSVNRYQRRQRTLIGLSMGVILSVALAFFAGGWTWALTGLVVAATVVYLAALRSQVREEQVLRNRRIRQLRRARLGVLNTADEELAIPRHLRHPGAVILERDDESPDFDHLPVIDTRSLEEPAPNPTRTVRRPDRFHDVRRVS